MKRVFTTSMVPMSQRADLWQNFVCGSLAAVEASNFDPDRFEAHIDSVQLGDFDVAHYTGAEQSVCRHRQIIRSSDPDAFVAVVQMGGSISYEHGDLNGSHVTGSVTLFDITREISTRFHGGMDFIDVSIPRRRIEALLGSTRNLAGLTLGPEQPMTQLIIEFFLNQLKVADDISGESACRLGTIGADLLATGFLEKIGKTPNRSVGGAASTARAKKFIKANLSDCTLSPTTVAASSNISLRRMQELFAEEMLTITDYIWEQRLLRAKEILESQAFNRLSVADVACSVGFVTMSHFSRRFRSRFDCAPTDCRQTQVNRSAL
jgi:AraC family transcriptional activator of tynA and feaB